MPKQSAKDELIARIDADVAEYKRVSDYVAKVSATADKPGDFLACEVVETANAEISRLQQMRAYVTGGITDAPEQPKKRTRGKGKRGLPTTANVDGV